MKLHDVSMKWVVPMQQEVIFTTMAVWGYDNLRTLLGVGDLDGFPTTDLSTSRYVSCIRIQYGFFFLTRFKVRLLQQTTYVLQHLHRLTPRSTHNATMFMYNVHLLLKTVKLQSCTSVTHVHARLMTQSIVKNVSEIWLKLHRGY